jgi:hypothetical protein
MKTLSKTIITVIALTLSGTAFAETAKPSKPLKLDRMTTQSIETAGETMTGETMKCDGTGFKMMKACGDASQYPVNALSGMNLN